MNMFPSSIRSSRAPILRSAEQPEQIAICKDLTLSFLVLLREGIRCHFDPPLSFRSSAVMTFLRCHDVPPLS
ncbi:MAG: hypothetical protein WCH07_11755, partial [Deltaproteobacteria bacterium]